LILSQIKEYQIASQILRLTTTISEKSSEIKPAK